MEQTPGSPTDSSSSSSTAGPADAGSSPTSSASNTAQNTVQEVKGKAQQAARAAKSKAQQAAQGLKERGKQQLESGKEGAALKAEQLADAVNRASDELHQHHEDGLADYASQVASGITRFADTLRHRTVDDLIAETEAFARRSPTIFFLSSIGAGLALSRFLKASARNTNGAQAESLDDELDATYASNSEWQQSEASQSIYGGQPDSTSAQPATTSWSTENTDGDLAGHQGGAERDLGGSESLNPNNSPGGAYR